MKLLRKERLNKQIYALQKKRLGKKLKKQKRYISWKVIGNLQTMG